MAAATKLTNREHPELARVMRAIFPAYKGRKFRLVESSSVTLTDRWWSDGSRTQYVALRREDGRWRAYPDFLPASTPPWGVAPAAHTPTVTLPPHAAIVAHTIFCGHDLGLTLYVPPSAPAQMAAQLPPGQGCAACDCADPTAAPDLRRDCACSCHGEKP